MARTLAAERSIFSIEELHKRLVAHGITISSSQLGKVLRNQTRYCDLELLDALRKVLDTSYDKLLVSRKQQQGAPKRRATTALKESEKTIEQPATKNHEAEQKSETLAPPPFTSLPGRKS